MFRPGGVARPPPPPHPLKYATGHRVREVSKTVNAKQCLCRGFFFLFSLVSWKAKNELAFHFRLVFTFGGANLRYGTVEIWLYFG